MAQLLETKPFVISTVLPVFLPGNYHPTSISVDTSRRPSSPPKPLLIFAPSEPGTYPVILFFHGFYLRNRFYTDLLQHISSHGYIIVAPQLWSLKPPSGPQELEDAAKVADWLNSGGLQPVLPQNVEGDLSKLALVGHSRGGKTAFTLALGHAKTTQTFAALVGIDPVAGSGRGRQLRPPILTYVPDSFDLSIPITVIGTGLGPEPKQCMPVPCAPDGVNHEDFFNESRGPCAHFVAQNYGHMDMLDDNPSGLAGKTSGCMCVNGKGPRDPMRRSVGGIVVAFLDCYFRGEKEDFFTIVNQPSVAPIKLDPVQFKQ